MSTKRLEPQIMLLLQLLDDGFSGSAWHGTTVRGSIRGLRARDAAWKPAPERHSIWELVLHIAYWKYAVWRRLTGSRLGGFPRDGSNWLLAPTPRSDKAWKADIALLTEQHDQLRDAVRNLSPTQINRKVARSKWTYGELVRGVALHDLYHTGQIQLIKRLRPRT